MIPRPRIDISGSKFGRLLVIRKLPRKTGPEHSLWLCLCDCGQETKQRSRDLRIGKVVSCGCWAIEHNKNRVNHGQKYKRKEHPLEYGSYLAAKTRCTNMNTAGWKNYGGRGIQFKFASFDEFLDHIGAKPFRELSLDRINNDGHYELGNVRWATRKQQSDNSRMKSTCVTCLHGIRPKSLCKECVLMAKREWKRKRRASANTPHGKLLYVMAKDLRP